MSSARRRWVALVVVCVGQLMIVVDASIVNVALPAIQRDLHFTQSSLTWVIDAYMISYGGFLLLAGRVGRPRRAQARVPEPGSSCSPSPRPRAVSPTARCSSSSPGSSRASAGPWPPRSWSPSSPPSSPARPSGPRR